MLSNIIWNYIISNDIILNANLNVLKFLHFITGSTVLKSWKFAGTSVDGTRIVVCTNYPYGSILGWMDAGIHKGHRVME